MHQAAKPVSENWQQVIVILTGSPALSTTESRQAEEGENT